MKNILIIAITSIGLLVSQSSLAANSEKSPDWNNIEVNFVTMNLEDQNKITPKGLSIKGTKQFAGDYFAIVGYATAEDELNNINFETTVYSFGVGNKTSISDKTDLYASLTYEYTDIGDYDIEGVALTLGVKHIIKNKIELDAKIINLVSNSESRLGLNVSAYYFVNDSFSLGIGYSLTSSIGIANIGARYSF